tara:strand:- start:245 stop:370 length:126 start_codon:yes stop_codon:yes gene_type:complete
VASATKEKPNKKVLKEKLNYDKSKALKTSKKFAEEPKKNWL